MAGIGSHTKPNNGQTVEWLTPPEIVRAIGPFDLDVCCPARMPWRTAETMLSNRDGMGTKFVADSLREEWYGVCFCNPPYGTETGRWLDKLADHGDGIAVIFARTETAMFFEHVWGKASALLFLKGRPHFYKSDGTRAKGNSGGPVVLVAYGEECAGRLERCGIAGKFVRL